MALRLEDCNTLVRGNFNPYVVTPEWLARQKVLESNEAEVLLGALARGLRYRTNSVEWTVDTDRLLISSATEDCGALAAKVLRLLPHTPVLAVGNNFTFVGNSDDWGASPLPRLGDLGPTDFPDDLQPSQARWSATFPDENRRVEIAVIYGSDGMAVRLNFHRQSPNAEAAVTAAEEFSGDKKAAETLLKRIFDQEVAQ